MLLIEYINDKNHCLLHCNVRLSYLVYTIKKVVLRPILDINDAEEIVENGKTTRFRTMLQKPKKTEVHVHSLKLSYEAFLILSGKYNADYYRKATHEINVDSNDHHGKEIKMPYKMSQKFIESYPKRTLEKTKNNVKKPEITYEAAAKRLIRKLKKSVSVSKRNLEEKITIDEIIELYVPIYEARLIGPKKNVKIMRIDGIRKKIL